jgi:DNA-binding MarR family transcriptional regulator
MAFDRSHSAGYLINHLARIFAQALAERIRPLGLAPGQFPVLLALWEEDGLTQHALVERLDVEQATIANTLARMERDGLIVRTSHPGDRRAQIVRLTPRARVLEGPATAAAAEVNAVLLAGLPEAAQHAFIAAMRTIVVSAAERDRQRNGVSAG